MIAKIDAAGDADALENQSPVFSINEDDFEATLRDVRAFLDDPIALLERAAELLRRKRNEVATYVLFGVLAAHLWAADLVNSAAALAS